MRKLLVLVVLVAVAAVVVVLARDDGGPERTGSVTLVGDSLNVGIEPYLADVLPGWRIQTDDEVGRGTTAGLEALHALGSRLSPTVVISLGTNDPVGSDDAFRASVAEALAFAGSRRCVVWVTIFDGEPREELNRVLREAADANRNLRLVEWATMVEEEPELLAGDGVHGTAEGYSRRAEAVADAVRGCAPDAR
jgi:lysophospholipase L1-like esterase